VHGHREELVEALYESKLVDSAGDWCGGDATLWFLGDFVDRGPDGVGVIDLVMGLQAQAGRAGGAVHALLGNHEILLLGMHHFGDTEVPRQSDGFGPRSFARSWLINGGQPEDQDELTGEHVEWLSTRPLVAHAADHLLVHSDTLEYLEWGDHADELLNRLGGERIVHGHSVIADQLGIHPTEIEAPFLYAGGRALGIDGGLFAGGPCLVVRLPWEPED
jgi:hypothetical protein